MPSPDPRSRRTAALVVGLAVLLFAASRAWLIADDRVGPFDRWDGVRTHQFQLALAVCEGAAMPTWRELFPQRTEMHGALLLNAALAVPATCLLGPTRAAGETLAAGWSLLALGSFGWVLARRFGSFAAAAFCGLMLLPPPRLLTTTLFLMGSHTEGAALSGLLWLLAPAPLALLLLAGPAFFLWKGVAVPLLLLVPRALRTTRWRGAAAAAGGLLPLVALAAASGYRGWHLGDGDLDRTWWTGFGCLHHGPAELLSGFAQLFSAPRSPSGWLFAATVLAAAGWLAVRPPDRSPGAARLLVAHLALHLALTATFCGVVFARFYVGIYPVAFAVVAVALSTLPRRWATAAWLAWLTVRLVELRAYQLAAIPEAVFG